GLSWRPLRRRTPVLRELTLTIPAGQRVLVTGPSGAGKSTLLRAIAGLLLSAGYGELTGTVRIDGCDASGYPGGVGLLLQDPLAGIVAESAGRDVAFGLENAAVPRPQMWARVATALADARFPYAADHPTRSLSGGEAQRLVLAGHLVLDTSVLLLDEPTSMLDPETAGQVRRAVRRVVAERGCTTVIVEHHLDPWVDFVDRVVVLGSQGQILADGAPETVLATSGPSLAAQGVWVPGMASPEPSHIDTALVEPWASPPDTLVEASGVRVELRTSLQSRRAGVAVALDDVDASLVSGRALAVTGASGAGKSTLVSVLGGLLAPTCGTVLADPLLATRKGRDPWRWSSRDLAARLAWAPQSPEHGVVTTSVRDEVLAAARACGRDVDRSKARADGLLEVFGLGHLASANPYHLSGGEQRRLMVAAALAHGPAGVLLDEPTVGQDRLTWAAVLGAVVAARDAGAGVAVSTHDQTAVAVVADDRLVLCSGRVRP
nr:ATP-binding cassette domain-containing protein [Propionibacteriales bacterium]